MENELTPMMKQYLEIKSSNKDVFVFFRLGDFYELFFEDAEKASRILNITLTSRGTLQGKDIPMCGVPHHSVHAYLSKMIAANHKVAICEQMEDPQTVKGIVKRKILRVITPGTLIEDSLLNECTNNYLAALTKTGANIGLSYAEISTGEFKVTELKDILEVERELFRLNPSEILIPESLQAFFSCRDFFIKRNMIFQPDWIFEYRHAYQILTRHFNTQSLDGFGLADSIPGVASAGSILHYISDNCPDAVNQFRHLVRYHLGDFMSLDPQTQKNLEILETSDRSSGLTLVEVLDQTQTAMGARLLRQWIRAPLKNSISINERQDAVTELKMNFQGLSSLQKQMYSLADIERISGRISCGNASPRDLLGLEHSLRNLPSLYQGIVSMQAVILKNILPFLHDFPEVTLLIEKGISPDCPNFLRDGGVIRQGYDSGLDELNDIAKNAKKRIVEIQQNEIEKTGIKNLKIKFNNVFGYYFEISKGQLSNVPDYFIRKQTLVNAERFITPELKELESKILGAEQKSIALEQRLFNEIREKIAVHTEAIKASAFQIAILDCLCSLAAVSAKYDYVRPEISDGDAIFIKEGRHVVVERMLEPGTFITNDTMIDNQENQILLITGPNMAGKSTYIRQVALLVLLAQIGSHVPAKEAKIGVVDRIFTRVGASDDLSAGKSTFMVEMNETASILNSATPRSLIILDEIGRGTSTYDGMAIAWAVIEYLSLQNTVRAKTLFATHYHELTSLEKSIKGLKNYNISVKEWNDSIIFLRKIVSGPADKSYGIHVARLAGIPGDVINRSKEILCQLEAQGLDATACHPWTSEKKKAEFQLDLFAPLSPYPPEGLILLEKLAATDAHNLTPLQAITFLHEIVETAKSAIKKLHE
ncbi:MAG: DNA mismatch repair protein MutS [Candidatus Aureabacteria bacterium]|nr:DNA mismatch repair protein MutS [Candidatus Auribacterota bacterium]